MLMKGLLNFSKIKILKQINIKYRSKQLFDCLNNLKSDPLTSPLISQGVFYSFLKNKTKLRILTYNNIYQFVD